MLKHELRQDDGILALHSEGPFEAADFTALASDVDAYLARPGPGSSKARTRRCARQRKILT